MASKLLRWFGVLFVLLPLVLAIGGFMVLKDRVTIVLAADQPAANGPDPLALLRDDVRSLQTELTALQQAIASNFERFGEALEGRAQARHGEVLTLRDDVAAVRQLCDRLGGDVALRHAEVLARLAGSTAPPASAPTTSATAPAEPVAAGGSAAAKPPEAIAPSPPSPQPPPPAKAGFLSFTLPSTTFRFDAPQDYVVVAELSRVGFDAKSTLHDFTGVTSQVSGRFRADFDDPQGDWSGEIAVQAASLKTGVDGRDDGMREHLDTEHHPDLKFKIERFVPAPAGIDVAKQTAAGELLGTMTIRGQARSVRMPLQIEVDPQKRVVIRGQVPLKMSDYGIAVPSQLGVINVQDEVNVWVALRARLQVGAAK